MDKTCSKCKEVKPLEEFHRMTHAKDGHRPECKVCHCVDAKAALDADKPKAAAWCAAYYLGNKEVIIARVKKYKEDNVAPETEAQRLLKW